MGGGGSTVRSFFVFYLISIVRGNNQPPRSALKWIPASEVRKLKGGFHDESIVRVEDRRTSFCRAEVDGCLYPGEAWYSGGSWPGCRIITKTKVQHQSNHNYKILVNPEGAAKYSWRPWPSGTGNLNFPREVVKSDANCNLMLGRYVGTDENRNAVIDSEGYVYYQLGPGDGWYWDNNEYELLVERSVTKIEIIDLNYGDPLKKNTEKFRGQSSNSVVYFTNNNYDTEQTDSKKLKSSFTSSKSWSHSVQFGVSVGVEVEVTTPGKALLGGASATYGFEASFSYSNGWGSGESTTREVTLTASPTVPPRSRVKVEMVIMQTIEDVPFTAKYKVTYDDGTTKHITDSGVMKNTFMANSEVINHPPESVD